MPLSQGQILRKRYRIVKPIKQGGFGAIYRAWDLSLKKPVALKENLETSQDAHTQFIREATMLANLSHQHLPRVTDYFTIEGQGQYLVMDYVEGEDLQEMLDQRNGALPESLVLPWIKQVCSALQDLQNQTPPIIHRDIKPANIKVTPDGNACLVDFGIAKIYDPYRKTTEGARAVTPGYSPVEQYGQGSTDARSDIYALGATLYTTLTGQVPPESIQRVTEDHLIPPTALNPEISAASAAVITTAMQLNPAQRFQKVEDFLRETDRTTAPTVVAGTIQTPVQPATVLAYPPHKKKIPLVWIGLISGLFVVIVILMYFLFTNRGQPAISPLEDTPPYTTTFTSVTETFTSQPSETSIPSPQSSHTQISAPTISPTRIMPTATEAQERIEDNTATPAGPAMLVFDSNANCRGGPGQEYELLRTISGGTTKEILGRNESGTWYLIKIDDPSTRKKLCWVSTSLGHISGDPSTILVCSWIGDGYNEDQQCRSP